MRMIDADRLVKTIEKAQMESLKVNILSLINDAPTVFTQEDIDNVLELAYISGQQHPERPRGKWIEERDKRGHLITRKCPICKAFHDGMIINYCPNCGARMESDV